MGALLMPLDDDPRDVAQSFTEPPATWTDWRTENNQADKAYEYMTAAKFSSKSDPEAIRLLMDCAKVHAQLALMDKVEEMTATLKEVITRQCESMRELDGHIQTAAQHLHRDAADLKQHLRVVQGEAAA